MIFSLAKNIHLIVITLSLIGFIWRSIYFLQNNKLADKKLYRKIPHYIDTILLLSAFTMLWQLNLNPFLVPWLTEKLLALCLYIMLGMYALHWAKTKTTQLVAIILAVIVFLYIVYVAISKKSILGFLI